MPEKTQPKALQESKYFKLAGSFAKPLEEMLPEETLENIREKRVPGEKRNKRPNRNLKPKRDRLKKRAAGPETMRKSFLTSWPRPQIKKSSGRPENASKPVAKNSDGYNKNERDNLDRLIENTIE